MKVQCPECKPPQMEKEAEEKEKTNLGNIKETECSREVEGVEKRTSERREKGALAPKGKREDWYMQGKVSTGAAVMHKRHGKSFHLIMNMGAGVAVW